MYMVAIRLEVGVETTFLSGGEDKKMRLKTWRGTCVSSHACLILPSLLTLEYAPILNRDV